MALIPFGKSDLRKGGLAADGINTTSTNYWTRGNPYWNLMYQSEDNIRTDGATSPFAGTLNSDGYPLDYGTATNWIEWYCWSEIQDEFPWGIDWVLTWEGGGNGTVKPKINGMTPTVDEAQRRVYAVTESDFTIARPLRIDVADIDAWGTANYAADPIVNVRFEPLSMEGTCGYGEANFIRQDYIDAYSEFDYLRMMNFQATNQQATNSSWADRKPTTYRTFAHGAYNGGAGRHAPAGAPLTVCLEIAKQVGIRPWVCIPHEYDDASITAFFEYIRDNWDWSYGHPMIEWTNEFWNTGFQQGQWCQAQGLLHDASTRYVTLGSMADSNFNGDYFQSNNGEVAPGGFDTTNAAFHVFKRESGGTTYVLYHNQTSGNWEVATSTSDPDTWTNSQSVTLGLPETVTAVDDTWEDSTIGPDEGDANVTYTSRFFRDPYPLWYYGAFRSTQAMKIGKAIMDAAGLDWSAVVEVQTGGNAAQNDILNCNVSEPFDSTSTERVKDHHTSIGVTFYVGVQPTAEPLWSSNGAKDDSNPVPGTTQNAINWDPDISKLYDYLYYYIDTYHTNAAENDSWTACYNRIHAAWPDSEIIGYEGNHHFVRHFGGGETADGLAWFRTMIQEYTAPEWQEWYRRMFWRWTQIFSQGGRTPSKCHFVLVNPDDEDGHWALYFTLADAKAQVADGTYKMAEIMRLDTGHSTKLTV
jgi:hypothetical protein